MAINPIQKKSRDSFLLGMIISLIICLIIGALCFFALKSKQKQEEAKKGTEILAYVLTEDVLSGQVITPDIMEKINVYTTMIPENYVDSEYIKNYKLEDEEGNPIQTYVKEEKNKKETCLYIETKKTASAYKTIEGTENKIIVSQDENGFYKIKKSGEEKEYIKLSETPVVAKVDLYNKTLLTKDVIAKSDEKITDDTRLVEYNMITLPTTIAVGDYIDIRLSLPNGQDYIVVSKAQVMNIQNSTIGLYLTEDEIIMMNSAIVDAYIITASNLKAVQYVEAGMQANAGTTYTPSAETKDLIDMDKNIVENARSVLQARFSDRVRAYIDSTTGQYAVESMENIESNIQKEIQDAKTARENYLKNLERNSDI